VIHACREQPEQAVRVAAHDAGVDDFEYPGADGFGDHRGHGVLGEGGAGRQEHLEPYTAGYVPPLALGTCQRYLDDPVNGGLLTRNSRNARSPRRTCSGQCSVEAKLVADAIIARSVLAS